MAALKRYEDRMKTLNCRSYAYLGSFKILRNQDSRVFWLSNFQSKHNQYEKNTVINAALNRLDYQCIPYQSYISKKL
jgi:hypothetical protein